jgi:hypothetical protein
MRFVAFVMGALVAGAASAQVKLPPTIAWSAYDVGSGGYNQAVAIGNALKQKYNVSLRVLPGKNDISRNLPVREGVLEAGGLHRAAVAQRDGWPCAGEVADEEHGRLRIATARLLRPLVHGAVPCAETTEAWRPTAACLWLQALSSTRHIGQMDATDRPSVHP